MRRNRNADSQVIFGRSPQFGNGKRENGFATFSSRFAHPGINILYLLYATTCLPDGRTCQFDMSVSQIDGVEKYADEFLGTTQSPPYLFYTATFCRVDRVFGHKILGLSKRENIPHKSQTLPSHLEDLRIEPTGKLQHMQRAFRCSICLHLLILRFSLVGN